MEAFPTSPSIMLEDDSCRLLSVSKGTLSQEAPTSFALLSVSPTTKLGPFCSRTMLGIPRAEDWGNQSPLSMNAKFRVTLTLPLCSPCIVLQNPFGRSCPTKRFSSFGRWVCHSQTVNQDGSLWGLKKGGVQVGYWCKSASEYLGIIGECKKKCICIHTGVHTDFLEMGFRPEGLGLRGSLK